MPRTRRPIDIRAPARILVGLRFKNRCILCGKIIPKRSSMCSQCRRRQSRVIR